MTASRMEPTRVHDVSEILRSEIARFPEWFRAHVDRLAAISAEMAIENMEFVAGICVQLLQLPA